MPIRVKRNQTLELESSFANPPTGGGNGDINPFSRQMASDADMQIDCKIAIGMATRDLVCAIIQAGWSPGIAYSALKNVAKNQAVAYQHDSKPEQIAVGSILPQL